MKLGRIRTLYHQFSVYLLFDGYEETSREKLPKPYLEGSKGPGEHSCVHFKYTGATPKVLSNGVERLLFTFWDGREYFNEWSTPWGWGRLRNMTYKISGRVITISYRDPLEPGEFVDTYHLLDDKYYLYSSKNGVIYNSRSGDYTLCSLDYIFWPHLLDCKDMAYNLRYDPDINIFNDLITEACVNAKVNTNNIANISQIIDTVKVVKDFKKNIGKIPAKLSKKVTRSTCKDLFGDAWLTKRYSVDTTLSDVDEIQRSFVESLNDVHVFRNGTSISNEGDVYEYHTKSTLIPWVGGLQNINLLTHTDLQRVGLDPSLYNLWDLVPFSFIVDWFLPVGDAFEDISNNIWYGSMPYDVTNVVSLKHTHTATTAGEASWVYYVRNVDYVISDFSIYTEKNGKPSLRTWLKRSADAVALFF